MKKSIVMTLVAVALTAALAGCSFTSHVTTTETTTDADGNTTTVTTETTNDNGNVTTETTSEYTPASAVVEEEPAEAERISTELVFANDCGVDITELYFNTADSENFGDELLGENAPLADGERITFHDVTFDPANAVCNLKFTTDGQEVTFDGVDMNLAEDPANITITIITNGEDYQITF